MSSDVRASSRCGVGRCAGTAGIVGLVTALLLGTVVSPVGADVLHVYDRLHRLRATVDGSANDAAIWTYDAVGNILRITRQPATQVTILEVPAEAVAGACGARILGLGFNPTANQNTVTVGGTAATVQSATATTLVVCLGGGTTTGPVVVTTPTGTATSDGDLLVRPNAGVPTVTGVVPTVAVWGAALGLTGTGFIPAAGHTRVRLGATQLLAPVSAVTPTSLTATVPPGATSGRLTLTTPEGATTAPADVFIPPPPATASDVAVTARWTLGRSQSVTLPPTQQGLFVFDGAAGQRVCIGTAFTTGAGSVVKAVYLPSGAPLVPEYTGGDTVIELPPLPVAGTYQAQLRNASPSTAAAGTLTLYDASDRDAGPIVTDGTATVLTFATPCARTQVTFTGTAGQRVSLLTTGNLTLPASGTFVNPDGTTLRTLALERLGTTYMEPLTLTQSGVQTVWVDPAGSATGTMTLRLYDVVDVETPITPGGAPVTATIAAPGQRALLPFSGTAGQRASVRLDQLTTDGSAWVAQPDGTVLGPVQAFSAGQDRFFETPALPVTGTYRVVVDPTGPNTGAARVTLWTFTDVTGALTLGVATPVALSAPGQQARLTFTGTAGQRVTLQASNPSGLGGTLDVALLRPDGSPLLAAPLALPGSLGAIALPVAGSYTVVLDPAGLATGSLDLTVANATGAGLTLVFEGKIRDRVGAGDAAVSADGQLDGTLTATLVGGARTITQLVLTAGSGGGQWDTIPGNGIWVLGAAAGLDAALLNAGNGSLSTTVADGGTLALFATDLSNALFPVGRQLTLTATFSDATTAVAGVTVPPPPPPPGLTLAWHGKVRDRARQAEGAAVGDGQLDATLTATVTGGVRTVTQLVLSGGGGQWDTIPSNGMWTLAAADTLDTAVRNGADGSVSFAVVNGTVAVFATDYYDALFPSGRVLTLTVTFSDSTTAAASVTIP